MSLHRLTLVALATLFTGITSAAFAGCCEWGAAGSRFLRFELFERWGGGVRRLRRADDLCGGATGAGLCRTGHACTVPVATWGTGCGCHQSVFYAGAAYAEPQIVPAPIYAVNQGPEYSGPGIMMPYRTWSPAVAAAINYPYVSQRLRPPLLSRRALRLSRACLRPSALVAVPASSAGRARLTRGASGRFELRRPAACGPLCSHNPRAVSVGAIAAYTIALCAM